MAIDKERILFLIGEIEKSLVILQEFAAEKKEDLINDPRMLGSVKYYFIVSIEACIDICNHIVARERIAVPDSYSHCFRLLEERQIISSALASKMRNMAKFRNLLVHLYWKIDEEKVYDILQSELIDFDDFITQIAKKYL
ncbi:DUF86 domain-containing protein [bacterium]|nr:DUF86 domain-containing protein [bacterium]